MISLLISIQEVPGGAVNLTGVGVSSAQGHTPREQRAIEAILGFLKQRGECNVQVVPVPTAGTTGSAKAAKGEVPLWTMFKRS